MDFEQLSQYIAAPYLYREVTDEEYDGIAVMNYMTVIDGVRYVGADVPVEALADRMIEQTPLPGPEPEEEVPPPPQQ